MPKPHYGAKRDTNHHELVGIAEQIGGVFLPDPPFDGWLGWRGAWYLVEIKDPKKEGWKNEYTDSQVRTIARLKERGFHVHTWRTESDVYQTMGVRRTA